MANCDAHRHETGLTMRAMVQQQGVPSPQDGRLERRNACAVGWPAARFPACELAEPLLLIALITAIIRWSVAVF